MNHRVRVPIEVPVELRQAGRDVVADTLAGAIPRTDPAVTIADHGIDVHMTFDAAGASAAKHKAGYWLSRVSVRTRAFTYIPDSRSFALMEVTPC